MCFFLLIITGIILALYYTDNLPGTIKNSIDEGVIDVKYYFESYSDKNLTIEGYYQSWSSTRVDDHTKLGFANLPSYISKIYFSFGNPNLNYIKGSNTFLNTGLEFPSDFDFIKKGIDYAKNRNPNLKFILSVGGATYPWTNPNYSNLIDFINDLNIDGIDIDYENHSICSNINSSTLKCNTDEELINIIDNLRKIMPVGKILTAAVFSVGAYCTSSFPDTKYLPKSSSCGMWVNPLINCGKKLDEINIMSYDAGQTFSAYNSFDAYKKIFYRKIKIGLEVPPEAWGGDELTVDKGVEYARYSMKNDGGGVFIWSLNKYKDNLKPKDYLSPICILYNFTECEKVFPLS